MGPSREADGADWAVVNADDADTCTGASSCDATGQCKKKTGQPCGAPTECAGSAPGARPTSSTASTTSPPMRVPGGSGDVPGGFRAPSM